MNKQTILTNRPKEWAKDKAELAETRDGFFKHIAKVGEVIDKATWMEEYKTVDDFLKDETHIGKSQFYYVRQAAKVRVILSTRVESPTEKIKHLNALGKIPDADAMVAAYVEVEEKAASENREPTTKDYAKAAKKYQPDTKAKETPKKPVQAENPTDTKADPMEGAAQIQDAINALNALKRTLKEITEVHGTELILTRRNSILRDADEIKGNLLMCKPEAICPRCKGKKCPQCGNHGWVNKTLLDQLNG